MEEREKETINEASKEISREFRSLINKNDLDSLHQQQHLILRRLQDSNTVLSHFNEYSEHCFSEVSGDFARNTRLLRTMKANLEYIFQKLKSLKVRLLTTYPDAFADDSKGEGLDRRLNLEQPSDSFLPLSASRLDRLAADFITRNMSGWPLALVRYDESCMNFAVRRKLPVN